MPRHQRSRHSPSGRHEQAITAARADRASTDPLPRPSPAERMARLFDVAEQTARIQKFAAKWLSSSPPEVAPRPENLVELWRLTMPVDPDEAVLLLGTLRWPVSNLTDLWRGDLAIEAADPGMLVDLAELLGLEFRDFVRLVLTPNCTPDRLQQYLVAWRANEVRGPVLW